MLIFSIMAIVGQTSVKADVATIANMDKATIEGSETKWDC